MAVMIMAIGVVSVASMFPLAMIRSIQATQLTSAAVLRYNAEGWMHANRDLIFDPNQNGTTLSQDGREYWNTVYVVDPVGYYQIQEESSGLEDRLGNDGSAGVGKIGRYPAYKLLDWNGDGNKDAKDRPSQIAFSRKITGLPDSWKMLLEAPAGTLASDRKSMTFSTDPGLSVMVGVQGRRVTFFNALGTQSVTRTLDDPSSTDQVAPPKVSWNGRLPDWLSTIGTVRFEAQEFRYSWMLMVRRQPRGDATVEVVCFQGRPYTAVDEKVYTRKDGGKETVVFTQNSDTAYVQYPTANRPWIHKNGYVLDVQNAHWYRIQAVKEKDVGAISGVNTTEALLQLNRKAAGNGKWAVFMRGVVDVYPIGTKTMEDQ